MNSCAFIGRLGKEPELRYTPQGTAVTTLSIAVQDRYKNDNGDYGVTFVNLVAWKGLAETIANHCKKGDQIGVVARYQQRNYENGEGRKVYVHEFVVSELTFCQKARKDNPKTNDDPFADSKPIDLSDDDLPF